MYLAFQILRQKKRMAKTMTAATTKNKQKKNPNIFEEIMNIFQI